jgi:predicted nuclease of restriction endonuclease-like (RecB) superfamily
VNRRGRFDWVTQRQCRAIIDDRVREPAARTIIARYDDAASEQRDSTPSSMRTRRGWVMAGSKKKATKAVARRSSVRRVLGRETAEARFPAAPPKSDLPGGYAHVLAEIKARVIAERVRIVRTVNAALVLLYWDVGRLILDRQSKEGWGAKVIDRLAADLAQEFPDMRGFSARNLKYMRRLAEIWPDRRIVQRVVARLPWRHNLTLLQRVPDAAERLWYATQAGQHGWSQPALELQIDRQAHLRQGKALTNFKSTLPPADSDLAEQAFKDPYLFDFLGTADPRREREVEQALVDHIQRFLLELGAGFAFVGRQVRLEVGDSDFTIDLLFYHLKLRCYVVVELKAVEFDPAFVGQLNLYLSAVDDLLRHPADEPTIGLLLCRSKNKVVVEYALRHLKRLIGVAQWETELVAKLPNEMKGSLPTVEEIEAEMAAGGTQ